VTTSWDDGDPKDLKIAELLLTHDLRGTFYVPIQGYAGHRLSAADLRSLASEGFEIGAHAVSHRTLLNLHAKELEFEVTTCKNVLEQTIGNGVRMFCYPNGRYDAGIIRQLTKTGYAGARTTRMLSLADQFHPFEMPTTVQAYPHARTAYVRNLGRARNMSGLWKYVTEFSRLTSWVDLGKRLFGQVLENGGIWHLYGHSWEIDEMGIWNELREMLDYVSGRKGVMYLSNGELVPYRLISRPRAILRVSN